MSAPVSLCDELSVQILDPLPASVQVGSVPASHSPHTCAVGSIAISFVSLWVASRVHTLVSSPFAVQVAAFTTVHAPQSWTWAGGGVVPLSPLSHPVKDRAAKEMPIVAASAIINSLFFMLKSPFPFISVILPVSFFSCKRKTAFLANASPYGAGGLASRKPEKNKGFIKPMKPVYCAVGA